LPIFSHLTCVIFSIHKLITWSSIGNFTSLCLNVWVDSLVFVTTFYLSFCCKILVIVLLLISIFEHISLKWLAISWCVLLLLVSDHSQIWCFRSSLIAEWYCFCCFYLRSRIGNMIKKKIFYDYLLLRILRVYKIKSYYCMCFMLIIHIITNQKLCYYAEVWLLTKMMYMFEIMRW
jgi:hypothetical protein